MGFCCVISVFPMQSNFPIFDVLSEKPENRPSLVLSTPTFVVTTKIQNESTRGIDKILTFWKINNTMKFYLLCSQGHATITCNFFSFAQYI